MGFSIHENFSNCKEYFSAFLNSVFFSLFDQVYDSRLQGLKKHSLDVRIRLREHEERPKAIGMLRNSLNLSRTFLVQINNITDKDEIYTAKDLEELGKIISDTTVRCISLKFQGNTFKKRDPKAGVPQEWKWSGKNLLKKERKIRENLKNLTLMIQYHSKSGRLVSLWSQRYFSSMRKDNLLKT